ncbi:MAG: hypothetical protein ONA90_06225 [candidate division KSB1 bacterium]|nr:hypothetical protein [candidate division KSB1 bacterium]
MQKVWLAVIIFILALTFSFAAPNPLARLKGTVLYNQAAPASEAYTGTRDRAICGDRIPNETLLIHPNGGLQNVLVFIANILPESLPPLELRVELQNCRIRPHVQALGVGSQLTIRNNDPLLHNVHGRLHEFEPGWEKTSTLNIFKAQAETYFNLLFPTQHSGAIRKMEKPGLLRLRSDAGHTWMLGYILVMPHRYFAVTDAQGQFEFPALPAECYDLILWHETLGVKRLVVEVKPGETKELMVKWFAEGISHADTTKHTP